MFVNIKVGFTVLFIGLAVSFIIYFYETQQKKEGNENERSKLFRKLAELENYKPTKTLVSEDLSLILSVDERSKRICFSTHSKNLLFNYRDVLQSEIIEDGTTITKTSRGSQLGGALIGGILAGGVGAIIGGLSGTTETSKDIDKVQLRIVVNDINKPAYTITLFDKYASMAISVSTEEKNLAEARKNAKDWHNIISIIIKRADEEDKASERELKTESIQEPTQSNTFVADELMKLSELLKQGIITQEDLDKQKEKLLG